MMQNGKWISADDALRQDELDLFGTNDMTEIRAVIQRDEWDKAQERMTGMEAEQAEWESADGVEW